MRMTRSVIPVLLFAGVLLGCEPTAAPCNARFCPEGCCTADGQCEPPTNQTCGVAGAACVACGAGLSCTLGVCASAAGTGGGAGGGTGGGAGNGDDAGAGGGGGPADAGHDADGGSGLPDAGTSEPGAPRILSLSVVPPRLHLQGDTGASTVSALVSDPDGLQDLVGGRLVDPVSGGVYGVFTSTATPGAYTFSIDWLIMQAVRPVASSPLGGSDRVMRAEFFDLAGHTGALDLVMRLDCGLTGHGVCNNQCTLMSTSPTNCGECGRAAPAGQVCRDGQPQCAVAGQTHCPAQGVCVDLQTSASHCGACGQPVQPGQVCRNGQSVCATATDTYCPAQQACVNLQTNSQHCGACGQGVPPGQVCRNGQPACANAADTYCPQQGLCANLQTSASHCGACGTPVPTPLVCRNGAPVCATPGQTACTVGTAIACVDLQTNPQHCGLCGRSIAATPQQCIGGTPTCPASGESYCPSTNTCVDLQTSTSHCGACGVRVGGTATCVGGQPTCSSGSVCTSGTSVSGCLNDWANCGGCGYRCPIQYGSSYNVLTHSCSSTSQHRCSLSIYQSSFQLNGSSCNALCAQATAYQGTCVAASARYGSTTQSFSCGQVPWSSSGGVALYSVSCTCSSTALAPP